MSPFWQNKKISFKSIIKLIPIITLTAVVIYGIVFAAFAIMKIEDLNTKNEDLNQKILTLQRFYADTTAQTQKDTKNLIAEQNDSLKEISSKLEKVDRSITLLNRKPGIYEQKALSLPLGSTDTRIAVSSIESQSFGGIGIVFDNEPENFVTGIKIKDTIQDKPAHKAGIKPGSKIIKIENTPVSDMTRPEALEKLRGPVGSTVKLTYTEPHNNDQTIELTLIRELINPSDYNQNITSSGFLIWEVQEDDKKFIVTPENISSGKTTKTFTARNLGKNPVPPRNLKVEDIGGYAKLSWKIMPESTCRTQTTPPGETCSVIVQAKPTVDGQISGILSVIDSPQNAAARQKMNLAGYAKNIAGTLPDKVLGNGDSCPEIGKKAEIAISSTEGFQRNDGYFSFNHGTNNGAVKVFTAECLSWEINPRNKLFCRNPGNGHHSATMKEYSSTNVDGPWTLLRTEERYITASIICKSGIIEEIEWSW